MHHRRISGHQYMMARAVDGSGQHEPDSQTTPVANHLPTTTLIVVVVAIVVGLMLITGIAFCGYRAWKRKEARAKTKELGSMQQQQHHYQTRRDMFGKREWDLETAVSVSEKASDVVDLEKPKRAVLVASSDTWDSNAYGGKGYGASENVGWVPQVKGTNILAPKPSLAKTQQQQQRQEPVVMHYTAPSLTGSEILSMSPPPSYSVSNRGYGGASIAGTLSAVEDVDLDGGEKKGMNNVNTTSSARLEVAPSSSSPVRVNKLKLDSSTNTSQQPLPSPARYESFAADATAPPASAQQEYASASRHVETDSCQSSISRPSSASEQQPELPRLMSVSDTFTPGRDDELPVRVGDTVRMLEEYRDGWCLVQYLGRFDAAKGVVPRFCLQERKRIVPTHKASNSSMSSSMSYRR